MAKKKRKKETNLQFQIKAARKAERKLRMQALADGLKFRATTFELKKHKKPKHKENYDDM